MQNERDKLVELLKTPNKSVFLREANPHFVTEETDEDTIIADYLIANGVIVPPCKVGDEIWVVEEGDTTCYMFLAKSKGCVIATSWINDYDVDETIEYHIEETQDNLDTDLVVFSDNICFATREEAEQALKGGAQE
jgi:hypothetical protein